MSGKTSFEQLCAGITGYSFEESSMVRWTKEESYNDMIFKLVTKCETNLLFLPSPLCKVSQFTLDIVPNYSNGSAVSSAWQTCEKQGYEGLKVIGGLDPTNIPRNGCQSTYTFGQFVNSVIHSMESYFMFQKFNAHFVLNAMNLWNAQDESNSQMKTCAVVLIWKFEREPVKDLLSRSPLSQRNSHVFEISYDTVRTGVRSQTARAEEERATQSQRRKSLPASESSTPVIAPKRGRPGRRSVAPTPTEREMNESSEEDTEISFRQKPEQIIPKAVYLPGMSPEKTTRKSSEPMEVESSVSESDALDDITLGFEKAQPQKGGRKSTARKSLVPDWSDEEKNDILFFFDNLNPSQTEQSCIAITCKYATMQYTRELPSKLLYQWVQKKGRVSQRTNTTYELPEKEQKESILEFFGRLNPEISEVKRIAFTCKFLHMQYGVSVTSKEFYKWLNDKGKKTPKRR